jgi:hypothetical protein
MKIVNNIGRFIGLVVALFILCVMLPVAARAQSTFDYTTFSTTLTGGLSTVIAVATGIAAIMAGVLVWKKVAKYFNKAG